MSQPQLKKILYVEDDRDIQTIALLALQKIGGYTVKPCQTGEEALESVPGFAPDLILLDVMMPGMGGIATLKELKARPDSREIPTVLMTAKVRPEEIAQYKALGAVWVIMKPFDPMTLSSMIQSIWEKKPVNGEIR